MNHKYRSHKINYFENHDQQTQLINSFMDIIVQKQLVTILVYFLLCSIIACKMSSGRYKTKNRDV